MSRPRKPESPAGPWFLAKERDPGTLNFHSQTVNRRIPAPCGRSCFGRCNCPHRVSPLNKTYNSFGFAVEGMLRSAG